MELFSYNGPVMLFNRCIENYWRGKTYAKTEKEAKRNLEYQYKREHNYVAKTKISLPGKVITYNGQL